MKQKGLLLQDFVVKCSVQMMAANPDTLHMEEIWISESLLAEALANENVEILAGAQMMNYENYSDNDLMHTS